MDDGAQQDVYGGARLGVVWSMATISALKRLKQEGYEFEASQSYIDTLCQRHRPVTPALEGQEY